MQRAVMASTVMLSALGATVPATGYSQVCPSRVIRIISSEPGGSYDFAARVVAPDLTVALSQQVVVENRGGMLGILGSKAAPDGCTLVVSGNNLWLRPLYQESQYDMREFAPVSLINSAPNVLVVQQSFAANSVADLIAMARARPGELNYGTGNEGSVTQVAAEVFSAMSKLTMVRVPYKGGGPAVTALVGGQIHLMFATGGSVRAHLDSGRLKALAVTSLQPSSLFPGVPTMAQTLPGFEVIGVSALLAPASTPRAIVEKLNQELNRILVKAEVKERFFKSGVEARGSSTDQLAAFIKSLPGLITRLQALVAQEGSLIGG